MTQSELLALFLDRCRKFTEFYGRDLTAEQVLARPVDGCNRPLWILAHLAVVENGLVLASCGGEPLEIPWADGFRLGASGESPESWPNLGDVWSVLDAVHEKALTLVRSLTDSQLDGPPSEPAARHFRTVRDVVVHASRHEAYHGGQVALLARALGHDRKI